MSSELPHADFCLLLIICELSLCPASYCMLQPTQLYSSRVVRHQNFCELYLIHMWASPVFLERYFPNVSLALDPLAKISWFLTTWTLNSFHSYYCFVSQLATHFQFWEPSPWYGRKLVSKPCHACCSWWLQHGCHWLIFTREYQKFFSLALNMQSENFFAKVAVCNYFLKFPRASPRIIHSMFNNIGTPYPLLDRFDINITLISI